VVSQSLDPNSNNNNLLGNLQNQADQAISDAYAYVRNIVDISNTDALNRELIENRLNNEKQDVQDELIKLCGLPEECTVADLEQNPLCDLSERIKSGSCGFKKSQAGEWLGLTNTEVGSNDVSTSEAGQVVLQLLQNISNFHITQDEYRIAQQRYDLAYASAEEFSQKIDAWMVKRDQNLSNMNTFIEQNVGVWTEDINELAQNIKSRNQIRQGLLNDSREDAASWGVLKTQANDQFNLLDKTSKSFGVISIGAKAFIASFEKGAFKEMEKLPAIVGQVNDPSTAKRAALLTASTRSTRLALGVWGAGETAALALEYQASSEKIERESELFKLQEIDKAEDLAVQSKLVELVDQVELISATQDVASWKIRELIDFERQSSEFTLAYERDKMELLDRRQRARSLMLDLNPLDLQKIKSFLSISQSLLEYNRLVLEGELLLNRYERLIEQERQIDALIGSPSVIFAWAGKLNQAEITLNRAKFTLMNWLIALEYYAVRPFMDQRIRILLARNPAQLDIIKEELNQLQADCGGQTNSESTVIKLTQALNIDQSVIDEESGEIQTPKDRLHNVLNSKKLTIDRKIRISNELFGSNMEDQEGLWRGTFMINLEGVANLESSCNARINSIEINLIGENLGEGYPSISLIKSDQSLLRSCQPNLENYLAQFGLENTSFRNVTRFKSSMQSISPPAQIGELSSDPESLMPSFTLAGLPLAGEYMVLIDKSAGDNPSIDWDQLEDIHIRFNYFYQDYFVPGACE
jgi:hypothetical protein